jgi:hypothetical protein
MYTNLKMDSVDVVSTLLSLEEKILEKIGGDKQFTVPTSKIGLLQTLNDVTVFDASNATLLL